MQFDDCYSSCVYELANFRSKFRLAGRDLYLSYAAGAYAYLITAIGPSAQCEYWLNGDRTGHMLAGNGLQRTYNAAKWQEAGTPKDAEVWECFAKAPRNAPYDWHWSIRPKCHLLVVDGAAADTAGLPTTPYATGLAGYDPWIGKAIITNCKFAIFLRPELGSVATTITIDDLTVISTGHPSNTQTVVGVSPTIVCTIRPTVHIRKGTFRMPAKHAFTNNGNGISGPMLRIIVDEAYFDACSHIVYFYGTNDLEIEVGRYIYDNRNNTGQALSLVRYDLAITDKVRLLDGLIIAGATYPTGLVHVASGAYATSTMIGTVRSSGRGIRKKTPTSYAGATAAITSLWCSEGGIAVWRVTQSEAASITANTSLYFSEGDTIEYTDPDAGDNKGLVCTTEGAGGTAVFKAFGVIAA
jgi:hypothetical protein